MKRLFCPAGLTIVELVVSLTVTLVVMACVFASVSAARDVFAVQPEASDLQQRLRVGVGVLMQNLLMAGAGMTFDGGAPESQAAPLAPYRIGDVAGGPDAGRYYRPDVISIAYALPRSNDAALPLVRHTYYLKRAGDVFQLMHYDGRQTDFPVLDDVVQLGFDYLGDPRPPELIRAGDAEADSRLRATYGPSPPALSEDDPDGVWRPGENCTWAVLDGEHQSKLSSLAEAPGPVDLDPAILTDGPWCPAPAHPDRFDADLLRVRRVRVQIRVQAPPAFRGPQGVLFLHGGTAPAAWYVPDQEIRFDVAPRNMQ